MLGYIGLSLLVLCYILLVTRWSYLFIPIDIVASFILTLHAISIWDIPFMAVNGFITVLLTVKYFQGTGI